MVRRKSTSSVRLYKYSGVGYGNENPPENTTVDEGLTATYRKGHYQFTLEEITREKLCEFKERGSDQFVRFYNVIIYCTKKILEGYNRRLPDDTKRFEEESARLKADIERMKAVVGTKP